MADEPLHDDPTHDPTHEAEREAPDADAPDADAVDDTADDAADEGTDGSPPKRGWRRVTASRDNLEVVGRLVLHYAERDVVVHLDGDAAMRIMCTHVHGPLGALLADELDPLRSPADAGWLVLEPSQPLAMSWIPGPTPEPRKMAFEPS